MKKLLALALMIGGLTLGITGCQKSEPPTTTEPPKVEQPAPPATEAPATTSTTPMAPATGNAATTR